MEMKHIKINDVDFENAFLHFTRIDNRESIQKYGLIAVAGGENGTAGDKERKTIYFVKGVVGMFEAIDAWARWEYHKYYKLASGMIRPGFHHKGHDKGAMLNIYGKMYSDFKDRFYYLVDFKKGEDYVDGDIDMKKKIDSRDEQGEPFLAVRWMYGPYSQWGTPENPNNNQEIWNMNTKIGERTIPADRLKIIETANGRTDALSVILEMYDKYRETVDSELDGMLKILDEFVIYAKERYKNDKDFIAGMPDVGRRAISLERQKKLQDTNKIPTPDIER